MKSSMSQSLNRHSTSKSKADKIHPVEFKDNKGRRRTSISIGGNGSTSQLKTSSKAPHGKDRNDQAGIVPAIKQHTLQLFGGTTSQSQPPPSHTLGQQGATRPLSQPRPEKRHVPDHVRAIWISLSASERQNVKEAAAKSKMMKLVKATSPHSKVKRVGQMLVRPPVIPQRSILPMMEATLPSTQVMEYDDVAKVNGFYPTLSGTIREEQVQHEVEREQSAYDGVVPSDFSDL